jgi:hypothetical protein
LRAAPVQADALEWLPDEPFEAIYEQTCLCALHPDGGRGRCGSARGRFNPVEDLSDRRLCTRSEALPPSVSLPLVCSTKGLI